MKENRVMKRKILEILNQLEIPITEKGRKLGLKSPQIVYCYLVRTIILDLPHKLSDRKSSVGENYNPSEEDKKLIKFNQPQRCLAVV